MRVQKIWGADIYRDGGSYGFCFDSDDGQWYEFFLKTRAFEPVSPESHQPPIIYRNGCNSGEVVLRLSWEEAQAFVAPLRYENRRFMELIDIVMTSGGTARRH
ncbi:hypothetical protein [Eleftheria terrae]|uniref:hypothetical protein n=1 Tax=Eleftheria terrae TaxID=1597781 RepID=UPI00263AD58D|nr:hypothetical protein [Eleftheria terrae]WKB56016.1 hypothetical protein N7L95_28525 [Eleftheria terrae]